MEEPAVMDRRANKAVYVLALIALQVVGCFSCCSSVRACPVWWECSSA